MDRRGGFGLSFKWTKSTAKSYELYQHGAKQCIARVRAPDKEFDEKDWHASIFHRETELLGGGAVACGYSPTLKGAINLAEAMIQENSYRRQTLKFDRSLIRDL